MGGCGQILITIAFRCAPVSVVAPFDYMALVYGFILGWAVTEVMLANVLAQIGRRRGFLPRICGDSFRLKTLVGSCLRINDTLASLG